MLHAGCNEVSDFQTVPGDKNHRWSRKKADRSQQRRENRKRLHHHAIGFADDSKLFQMMRNMIQK
jgi:hypothetical protein